MIRRTLVCAFAAAALLATAVAVPADEPKKEKPKLKEKDAEKPKADPHAEMIGKPAPEITADFAFNGDVKSLEKLKGKVVLVDFWAVWCGWCVKGFPHLTEWNKEYKDKGLAIVGVSGYYPTLEFDKETTKLGRKKKGEELTAAQEQESTKNFVAHHKLDYQQMLVSKEAKEKMDKEYKVRGIPHYVLIDRKGVIRKIQVGYKEDGSEMEDMIKKLLAEKE